MKQIALPSRTSGALEPEALLHPAGAFARPMDVINDLDLTLSEKRAILASWASDACAVEAAPALRHVSGATVPVDKIFDALRLLDAEAREARELADRRRRLDRRRSLETWRAVKTRISHRRGEPGPDAAHPNP